MKFDELFKHVNIPVIILSDDEYLTVVYENKCAIRLLNPLGQTETSFHEAALSVTELFGMEENDWERLMLLLDKNHDVPVFDVEIKLYSGQQKFVSLAATQIVDNGEHFIQLCIQEQRQVEQDEDVSAAIRKVFDIIYRGSTTEDVIRQVLAFAGDWANVCRSYIFEAVNEVTTSNTYEWCAPGVESMIEQLKDLPRKEYSYDLMMQKGVSITDDIRKLPPEDRKILETQGIKSIAIFPIISYEGPLGYVGLDDCRSYRTWTQREVQFLERLSDIFSSLLIRRNTERRLRYGLEVLDVVINSLDSMIMAVDIHTHQVLFVNNSLARLFGACPEQLKDKPLTEVFGKKYTQENYQDPMEYMVAQDGEIKHSNYVWEYYNKYTKKWFLVRGSIIKWIDGRDVLIQTSTEFTNQKKHEAELEYVASIDMMTGAYNREWSRKLLEKILEHSAARTNNALVFVDMDRLKQTNDYFGHAAGDKMIMDTLACIRSCTRKSDVLCRWGGDEFLIIIRANEGQAEVVVNKIWAQMNQYNEQDTSGVKLSFSYGIVEIDAKKYKTVEELVNAADQKMYINKQRLKKD